MAALYAAVRIRLFAVINYGRVIHEFDPWFNYRATEYMVEHGWEKFQAWYDDKSWYPLGRHVGSTTYPGLQLTAWGIHSLLEAVGYPVPLNDVCVFIPAGFGAIASLFTGAMCFEITKSSTAAATATLLMAVLPAHLMRSVAGARPRAPLAPPRLAAFAPRDAPRRSRRSARERFRISCPQLLRPRHTAARRALKRSR